MKREPPRCDEILGEWDRNDLLHPAQAFESPAAVLKDPDLIINEKRAILASWASDACAVEAAQICGPRLRAASYGSTRLWKRCALSIRKPTAPLIGAFCEAGGSWTEDAVIRQLAVPLCNKGPREGTPRLHTRSAREVSRDRRAFYLTGCGDLGRAGQAKGDRHDTRLPGLRQR